MNKVISRKQLMKGVRKEMPKPTQVIDKKKYSRLQKHKKAQGWLNGVDDYANEYFDYEPSPYDGTYSEE